MPNVAHRCGLSLHRLRLLAVLAALLGACSWLPVIGPIGSVILLAAPLTHANMQHNLLLARVVAFAGAAKTTTLKALAQAHAGCSFLYAAYNRVRAPAAICICPLHCTRCSSEMLHAALWPCRRCNRSQPSHNLFFDPQSIMKEAKDSFAGSQVINVVCRTTHAIARNKRDQLGGLTRARCAACPRSCNARPVHMLTLRTRLRAAGLPYYCVHALTLGPSLPSFCCAGSSPVRL